MAALGVVEMGAHRHARLVSRRRRTSACGPICAAIRTGSTAMPRRSTATAAPSSAATRRSPGAATVALCTRDGHFELADHKDCAARGLNSAGFAVIDVRRPAVDHRALQGTVTVVPAQCPVLRRAVSATSKPGCSISTTRSIPHHLNLWQQVDDRIRAYVSDFLKVSKDEAFRVQKDYYKRYGTTMRGLMTEHGMKPDDYLEFVHQIDHSPLTPNPALGAALEKLPGRKLILTNGTRKHADAVMKRLEIDQHFEDVFDIVAADLDPKPLPQVYERFLNRHDVDPRRPRCSRISRAISRRRTRSA